MSWDYDTICSRYRFKQKKEMPEVDVYGIGQFSRKTGCPIETIRYYERINLLSPPIRTTSGHRRFQNKDVKNLSFIQHARSLGFSIEDIRALMGRGSVGTPCTVVQKMALEHLEKVKNRIAELSKMASILESAAAQCTGEMSADCYIKEMLSET